MCVCVYGEMEREKENSSLVCVSFTLLKLSLGTVANACRLQP